MTDHPTDGPPGRCSGSPGGGSVPGVLDALRDGWHSLGGGDATRCPGCPVCRLGESAGRLDPTTTEHLQQAVGHLVAAGHELLAALQPPEPGPPRDDGPPVDPPPTTPGPRRTRIPVHDDADDPADDQPHSDEEHP